MAELDRYAGPNVAVDIAVLTYIEGELAVLVQSRPNKPRGKKVLPGRFLRQGETLADGLRIALADKAGVDIGPITTAFHEDGSRSMQPPRAHLVGVFDKPKRDKRSTWSMSLAHYLVIPPDRVSDARGDFVAIGLDGSVGPALDFDHDAIVRKAALDLRERYELTPDPENLLTGPEITLPELQTVHEAVLGERLRVDTFRRRMVTLLDEVIDPDDPKARRSMTRPSGPSGGPPTRLWTKRSLIDGIPEEAHRLLRLPRRDD